MRGPSCLGSGASRSRDQRKALPSCCATRRLGDPESELVQRLCCRDPEKVAGTHNRHTGHSAVLRLETSRRRASPVRGRDSGGISHRDRVRGCGGIASIDSKIHSTPSPTPTSIGCTVQYIYLQSLIPTLGPAGWSLITYPGYLLSCARGGARTGE